MRKNRPLYNYLLIGSVIFCFSCSDQSSTNEMILIEDNLNSVIPPSIEILSIEETDIDRFYEIKFNGMDSLYAYGDGKYLISGDIYKISKGKLINKSEVSRDRERKIAISSLDSSDFITFKKENMKHSVVIFTDVDCVYCRKFHSQILDYNALGIEVHYIAFPRSGVNSTSYKKMVSAWCSKDSKNTLTSLKLGQEIKENLCEDNPVEKHFNLGNSLGVRGTPSIITSEGRMIPGYLSPQELLEQLEI